MKRLLVTLAVTLALSSAALAEDRTGNTIYEPFPSWMVSVVALDDLPNYDGAIALAYQVDFYYKPELVGNVQFAGHALPRNCGAYTSDYSYMGARRFRMIALCLAGPASPDDEPGLYRIAAMIFYKPLAPGVSRMKLSKCSALGNAGVVCDSETHSVVNVQQ